MRKMWKIRNCTQLIFVVRKMRKFVPTRKPVALETLLFVAHFTVFHILCISYLCIFVVLSLVSQYTSVTDTAPVLLVDLDPDRDSEPDP